MLHNKKIKKIFSTAFLLIGLIFLPAISSAESNIAKPAIKPSQVGSTLIGCIPATSKIGRFLNNLVSKKDTDKVATKDPNNDFRQTCLNKIGYLASRIAIQQITNRTVAWINSGFDGNPFWTTDDQNFYKKIQNTQIKDLVAPYAITKQGGQAFAKEIAKQLIMETKQTFEQKTAYTGPGKVFTNDFQKGGGWTSWYNLTSNPANDPLGFALLVTDQKEKAVQNKIAETSRELQNNKGFLSQKKCVNPKDYKPLSDFEKKQAQGDSTVFVTNEKDFIDNYFNNAGVNRSLVVDPVTKQLKKDPKYDATLAAATKAYASLKSQAEKKANDAKSAFDNSTCLEWKTVTPGSVISEQLTGVLGSPLRQAELADDMNKSFSAVFDALLNQLAQKGLDSLSQKSGYNYKAMYPTDNLGINSSTPGEPLDSGDYWQGQGREDDPFKVRSILPTTIEIQDSPYNYLSTNSSVGYLQHIQAMSNEISVVQEDIGELDYCVPGPTPNWRDTIENDINKIVAFSYGAQDSKDRDQLMSFITNNFFVTPLNDNHASVSDVKDKWLNGSVDNKVSKIQEAYDGYSKMIADRYENPAIYQYSPVLTPMWNIRQQLIKEMDHSEEYTNTLYQNSIQLRATGEATDAVKALQPKYDSLFTEVCDNIIDGVPVNKNKLPCVCDRKYQMSKNNKNDIFDINSTYHKAWYVTCQSHGYIQ